MRVPDGGPHSFRHAFARERTVAAALEGGLGELARSVGMQGTLAGMYDDPGGVEAGIFRAVHARAVAGASPLALDLLAHWGLDPDGLVSRLRPRGDWRRWICGARPPEVPSSTRWSLGAPPDRAGREAERDAFLYGGLVVREWGDPEGAVGIRLSPAGLEVGARIGPVHLRTLGGVATATTALAIPAAIRAAAPGRAVEQIFDHPVLRGRGYLIRDQYDRVPTGDDPREAWRIEFAAEPVPWRVPWAA